jgi:hypothetical protein
MGNSDKPTTSESRSNKEEPSGKQSTNGINESDVKQLPSWVEGKKIGFNSELLVMFNVMKDNLENLIEQEKRKLSEYTKVRDKFAKIGKPKL